MIKNIDSDINLINTTNQAVNVTNNNVDEKIIDFNTEKKSEYDFFLDKCTDGQDDGKLNVGEKILSCGIGLLNKTEMGIKDILGSIIEQPLGALFILGTTALIGASGCSALIGLAGITTIGIGTYNIYKSVKELFNAIKEAKNATSDIEAKQEFAKMGEEAIDIGLNSLVITGGVKCMQNAKTIKNINNIMDKVSFIDEARERTQGLFNKKGQIKGTVINVATGVGETIETIYGEAKNINPIIQKV